MSQWGKTSGEAKATNRCAIRVTTEADASCYSFGSGDRRLSSAVLVDPLPERTTLSEERHARHEPLLELLGVLLVVRHAGDDEQVRLPCKGRRVRQHADRKPDHGKQPRSTQRTQSTFFSWSIRRRRALREERGSVSSVVSVVAPLTPGPSHAARLWNDDARRRRRYVTRKMLYSTPRPSMIRPWPTNTPCCSAAYLGSDVSNRGLVRKYC